MKVLYFEAAGCPNTVSPKLSDITCCRIRTAFHNDKKELIYLEVQAIQPAVKEFPVTAWVDFCTDRRLDHDTFEFNKAKLLRWVNNRTESSFDAVEVLPNLAGYRVHEGQYGYNFGDEFQYDPELTAKRIAIENWIEERDKGTGIKHPCFSLYVDQNDDAILHYKNYRRNNEEFDIFVKKSEKTVLPLLTKENAVVGAAYAFCDDVQYVQRIYTVSDEYARENKLMFKDRVTTTAGDFALVPIKA